MQKEDLRRYKNLFIELKNNGLSIDEIISKISIDRRTIEEWNLEFEKLLGTIKDSQFESKILSLNESLQFVVHNSFSLNLNILESAKLDLQLALMRLNDEDLNDDMLLLRENLRSSLRNFNLYFESISDLKRNGDEITGRYTLKEEYHNSEEIRKVAQEAIKNYMEMIFVQDNFEKSKLIRNTSPSIYANFRKTLPYSLKTLRVKNFECIKELDLSSIPIDTNWIFFTGENGYGKSSILKAIAIGLFGVKDSDIEIFTERNDSAISLEYSDNAQSIINNSIDGEYKFPHLACYGPSRLQIQNDETRSDIKKKSTTTYSLFNPDGILLNIESEMLIWYLEKEKKFEKVKKVFQTLIPYLHDIIVDVPKRQILYIEKELNSFDNKIYTPIPLEKLATGFRSLILMIGDMILRLFSSQPKIKEPSKLKGIVIIDELDLHWHPKVLRELPKMLSNVFPKIQFIVSTHSIVPLLGATKNSLFYKVNRNTEKGVMVEKIDYDISTLTSDEILRDVFELENYLSDEKQKAWDRYNELNSLIYFEENKNTKKKYMKEFRNLGNKFNFPIGDEEAI